MGAIVASIYVMIVALVGLIYFKIEDRKNAKK